jgi:hypothetical protein
MEGIAIMRGTRRRQSRSTPAVGRADWACLAPGRTDDLLRYGLGKPAKEVTCRSAPPGRAGIRWDVTGFTWEESAAEISAAPTVPSASPQVSESGSVTTAVDAAVCGAVCWITLGHGALRLSLWNGGAKRAAP